jgi:hypothetical protein
MSTKSPFSNNSKALLNTAVWIGSVKFSISKPKVLSAAS